MSDEIKNLQEALFFCGSFPGTIDGINGPKTKAAIKNFQESCGLSCDGICGPQTKAHIAQKLDEAITRAKGLQGYYAGGATSAIDDM